MDQLSLEELNATLGNRIRRGRRSGGMTLEELAGKIGVTYQQVQKYEKAINRVSAARLWRIADETQLPIEFFFRDEFSGGLIGDESPLRLAQTLSQIPDEETRLRLINLFHHLIESVAGGSR